LTNHLSRYRQVADILARHGLGILVGMAGLEHWLPLHHGLLGHDRRQAPYTNPEHLRLALEELGPTFVKLGQVLSTRPDLLPSEYAAELAVLQDSAPPIPGPVVMELITQELGVPPEEAFASFDLAPLASASIGQAHAATLVDGTDVVVKLRRPGAREQIETDLEILQNLATRAGQRWEAAADYDLPGIAEEFARTLRAELDYLAEGRNAERFAANFASDQGIHIPRVVWETTTSRVLTLERIRGVKVNDLDALDAAGIDRRALAVRAAGAIAKMIFEDEFFHADPHPGNLLIESRGRIGLIDFGMVGEVDEVLRDQLAVLLLALTHGSPAKVASALADMSVGHGSVDRVRLSADMVPVVSLYRDHPLSQLPLGRLISELLSVVSRHRLQLPREMALLFKMVIMAEGMGVLLDPEFQLTVVLGPHVQRLAADRFSAAAFARGIARTGADAAELAAQIPGLLQGLRRMLDAGGPEVHLRAAELEPLVGRMESVGRHLVAATLAAAFIRGVGELVSSDNERLRSWQRPLLGAGLGAVGTLGGYLAWTARSRRS
jgi:ubiquinone biosynthesis protein